MYVVFLVTMKRITVFFFVLDVILAYDSGYPAGYLSDCPGMNRTTTLSEQTRESLTVVVSWPSTSRFSFDGGQKTCKLGKAGVGCVAKHMDFSKTTKVMISGYLDVSPQLSPFLRTFMSIELDRGRNVLMLETSPILWRSYPIAARSTKPLGLRLGEFLARLSQRGLSPDRLEILGGSLGAHIGYYASVKYYELTGQRPARLTGLDPAGPCFRNLPPSERFNAAAARRVDALHTNIDGFGLAEPVGHVDFYANGGEFQPAMAGSFLLPCFLLCSHVRAAFYWTYANRNPDKFLAVRCDSIAQARRGDCYDGKLVTNLLGPKTNFTREGIYYLPTSEAAPYYIGKEALRERSYGTNEYLTRTAEDRDLEL